MNDILKSIIYPKVETAVYADGLVTRVHVSLTFSPGHAEFDCPQYIENKYKKQIPVLESIGVTRNSETKEQSINVTLSVKGKFNSVKDIEILSKIGTTIAFTADERLSEPVVIKAIGEDCKPWLDDEEE